MRAVTVYRVDYTGKTKDPIGAILEKRKTERAHNYHDLLRLARRLFALDSADALRIVIDVRHAREAFLPESPRGFRDEVDPKVPIRCDRLPMDHGGRG